MESGGLLLMRHGAKGADVIRPCGPGAAAAVWCGSCPSSAGASCSHDCVHVRG